MSAVVIAGNTSGTVTLQAPSVAGSTVLNLPTISGGTLVTSDSSGIVSIGGTAQNTDGLQVMGTGASANLSEFRFSNNSTGANIKLNKSRGTTVGAQGAVTNGDNLGTIYSYGSDGTSFIQSGSANFYCNGTVSTGIVPTSYTVALMNSSGVINSQLAALPDGTFQINAGYGAIANAYGCRAWVNFNGVSGSVATRASGNVTSVTRSAAGTYVIAFTTAMPDANYSVTGNASNDGSGRALRVCINSSNTAIVAPTTTSFTINTTTDSNVSTFEASYINLAVFR